MSDIPTSSRTRRAAVAGLLGVVAALTAVTGAGPAPSIFQLTGGTEDVRGNCDELEHASDASCAGSLTARSSDDESSSSTSSTLDDSATTSAAAGDPAPTDVRTVNAGDAGSIMVAVEGTSLRLLTASPNQGWQVEVERGVGREVEVTFRSGSLRVDVNVELEDGQIRERVRTRDDATDSRTETENGVVVPDSSGSGSSGSGSDDSSDDDSSGPGSDDSSVDDSSDDDSSGPGSDDSSVDDSSGHGGDDGPDHD